MPGWQAVQSWQVVEFSDVEKVLGAQVSQVRSEDGVPSVVICWPGSHVDQAVHAVVPSLWVADVQGVQVVSVVEVPGVGALPGSQVLQFTQGEVGSVS